MFPVGVWWSFTCAERSATNPWTRDLCEATSKVDVRLPIVLQDQRRGFTVGVYRMVVYQRAGVQVVYQLVKMRRNQ